VVLGRELQHSKTQGGGALNQIELWGSMSRRGWCKWGNIDNTGNDCTAPIRVTCFGRRRVGYGWRRWKKKIERDNLNRSTNGGQYIGFRVLGPS